MSLPLEEFHRRRSANLVRGGRLEVESAPGKGSRFSIWLPRRDTPGAEEGGASGRS